MFSNRNGVERFRDFDHVGPGTLAGRYLSLALQKSGRHE
jgi:hypothetical protein